MPECRPGPNIKRTASPELHRCDNQKEEKVKTLKGLRSAGGFIQRSLRKNLDLRTIPSIRFLIDDSLDHAEQISDLLEKAKQNL